jgi:hypothetical protein
VFRDELSLGRALRTATTHGARNILLTARCGRHEEGRVGLGRMASVPLDESRIGDTARSYNTFAC